MLVFIQRISYSCRTFNFNFSWPVKLKVYSSMDPHFTLRLLCEFVSVFEHFSFSVTKIGSLPDRKMATWQYGRILFQKQRKFSTMSSTRMPLLSSTQTTRFMQLQDTIRGWRFSIWSWTRRKLSITNPKSKLIFLQWQMSMLRLETGVIMWPYSAKIIIASW